MSQIILSPTHFTETSQSLIFLVTNPDNVVDCGVGEPFLNQLVRYHCPIYCILHFDRPVASTYKRKVWKFSNGGYPKLRRIVSAFDWNSCFHINIDIYAANFTKTLMSFCDTCQCHFLIFRLIIYLISMHMCNCILTFEFHIISHSLPRIAQTLFSARSRQRLHRLCNLNFR